MIKRLFKDKLHKHTWLHALSVTHRHKHGSTSFILLQSLLLSVGHWGNWWKSEGRDQEDSGSQSGPLHTFDEIKSKVKGESVCKRERLWLGCLAPELNIDTCTVSKINHYLMLASCTGLRPAFPTLHLNTNTANLKTDLRSAKKAFLPTPDHIPSSHSLSFWFSRPALHHIVFVVLNELIMNWLN